MMLVRVRVGAQQSGLEPHDQDWNPTISDLVASNTDSSSVSYMIEQNWLK